VKDIQDESGNCKELLLSCQHSSIMLLNLINDLLDLAKQEKLTFQLDKAFFSLEDTVRTTFSTLEFLSRKKSIDTVLDVKGDGQSLFKEIYGDQNRFEQIFVNFVSNALKFTNEQGKVEVRLVSQSLTKANKAMQDKLKKESSESVSPVSTTSDKGSTLDIQ